MCVSGLSIEARNEVLASKGSAISVAESSTAELNWRRWALFFVGLGLVIRLVRWGQRFELAMDEFMLCANFITRDYAELLTPLDYDQVAPVPFLMI